MKLENLIACLRELGLRYKLLSHAEGGTIVALERGSRIIGLFPALDRPNTLWTNPVLADLQASQEMFGKAYHWNIGGERVWLSPELEYHVAKNEPVVSYTVQQAVDPGTYRFREHDSISETIAWRQEGVARLYQSGKDIRFQLSKSIGIAADPLRFETLKNDAVYSYIGYETELELAAEGHDIALPLSSWSIIQVPAGGYAYASTYGKSRPTDFFAPTGSSHLSVSSETVRFKMDAKQSHKISLTSLQSTGRFGYYRQDDDGLCSLIVREISSSPSSEYLDTPWNNTSDRGHCVQLYNDDGVIGHFGELEHHAPAVKWNKEQGKFMNKDISQLWCYSGSHEVIARICNRLLGTEI